MKGEGNARCAFCGESFDISEMVEVENGVLVCETCAVGEYGLALFHGLAEVEEDE